MIPLIVINFLSKRNDDPGYIIKALSFQNLINHILHNSGLKIMHPVGRTLLPDIMIGSLPDKFCQLLC